MCLVLYGSETGNSADLADLLFDRIRRRHLSGSALKPFGEASLDELRSHRHVFVICSTTGQGSLPANTKPLWAQLLRRSLDATTLANVRLFSFGLGSSAYPKYNWAIRKIHARLLQLGATEATQRGEANEAASEPYESVFDQWMDLVLSVLDSELQIIDAEEPTALLPPLTPLALAESAPCLENTRSTELMTATVTSNDRITAPTHFQDVRHLSLSLNLEEPYEPGDVVCLYPANDDRVVDAVIQAQGWDSLAERPVVPPPQREYPVPGGWVQPLTLRSLLKWHVDLNSIPRRKFFSLAQHFCSEERQAERMQQFCVELDDLFDYTSRPRRSLAETILEFDSLRIPIEYILDTLPPLRLRQFSIASASSQHQLDIAVAIVKYRTKLRRVRRGICTYWIQQLQPNDKISVSIERNRMDLVRRVQTRPTIFVATGTGIAPIRSILLSMEPQSPLPYLFFGSRYKDQDFLYGNELKDRAHIVPAFSREGGGYVQDQITALAPQLPVESAFIFVCGSSGAMPRAVREALVAALQTRGFSSDQAEQLLARKEKNGEYMQETW